MECTRRIGKQSAQSISFMLKVGSLSSVSLLLWDCNAFSLQKCQVQKFKDLMRDCGEENPGNNISATF